MLTFIENENGEYAQVFGTLGTSLGILACLKTAVQKNPELQVSSELFFDIVEKCHLNDDAANNLVSQFNKIAHTNITAKDIAKNRQNLQTPAQKFVGGNSR